MSTYRLADSSIGFWLALKALAMALLMVYAGIGLGPDEAQYWTWSRALDWGYYSKPPGIAWQIGLGTFWFGQSAWAVRALAIPLSAWQAWAVYRLALASGLLPRTARWCGLLMAFCPLGIFGSFFAITDAGFLVCWTMACLITVHALQQGKTADPRYVGGWILAGALFKWPIYLFWLFFICAQRGALSDIKRTALGLLISLLGLLPSLWWNASHDWATFRHVWATLQGGSGQRAAGNPAEFLGAQALLVSPILWVLMLLAFWQWFRHRRHLSPPLFFCGVVSLTSLGLALGVACFQKMQGNWAVLAYPTALVVLGWDAFEQHPKRACWAKAGLALAILLSAGLFLIPWTYTHPAGQPYAPPYRYNPFKHNLGWDQLPAALEKYGYRPAEDFLFSDKYQTTSLLSFYGPAQKRAYFLNLHDMRKNQFSYWPSLQEEQPHRTGYFVWVENSPHLEKWETALAFYEKTLPRYFARVDFLGSVPLVHVHGVTVKAALIFRCQACHPLAPPESHRY